MPAPRIAVQKIGNQFGVVLRSDRVKQFGHRGMVIITAHTFDAAFDWISRLKSIRNRRQMRLFLIENGSFI